MKYKMGETHSPKPKKIGIWISEKKSQKLNWKELVRVCEQHNYELIKMDLEKPLEDQGDIDVFIHKLTDVITSADQNDAKAIEMLNRVEEYLTSRPNVVVIDPLDSVRILLNRTQYYTILEEAFSMEDDYIFTPSFAEVTSADLCENLRVLLRRGVRFPAVCKPVRAHGKLAHEMTVVFKPEDLSYCKWPCVVQSFVNHNAVLHKVNVVGNRYYISQCPSLKNMYASMYLDPIKFNTADVCKAGSQSSLSILDPQDQTDIIITYDEEKIVKIISVIKKKIGVRLAGIDVVVDMLTGAHAVIDINVFPSYDLFPNFFGNLMYCIEDALNQHRMTSDVTTSRALINVGKRNSEYLSKDE